MPATSLELEFADGAYTFKLTMAGINEIQTKCGAGIGKVWQRLAASRLNFMGEDIGVANNAEFHVADIVEVIRQGLIGGKEGVVDGQTVIVTAGLANRLVENYVLAEPLQKSWSLAYAIIGALIEGYDVKKKDVSEAEAGTTKGE
jgi:hypothetical protein